jgi:predicted nucleic acid-binding Zn ribbon protein
VPWQPLPNAREQEPERVGPALDRVLRGLGAAPAGVVGSLFARWEDIVGAQLAGHARPLGLHDGVLAIGVDDPAWATQVRFLESELIRRVREVTGSAEVARVEVRVRRADRRAAPP